nr:flippase-like domain-containing protein [candidate division Zixibacteria bacterium]
MIYRKTLRHIIGWLIAVIIIVILARTIYINREELLAWDWKFNWYYLLLSMILLMGAYLTASQAWRTIITGFGFQLRLHEAFRVVYLANLGRYIPGKVWQVFGMVGLAKELGIPAPTSLASFALVQGYMLPASFLLVPILLGRGEALKSLMIYRDLTYLVMGLVLLVFLILFFLPGGLNWSLNRILKIFRQEPVNYRPRFTNRIAIFFWYLVTWLLFGLSFHVFLVALIPQSGISPDFSSGAYIAAYNMGYISFISPGGLGVREWVMKILLAPYIGVPLAASIALTHRIWITIGEAFMSLLALLTYRIKSK